MTNEEKYKTVEDRTKVFRKFCENHECISCPIKKEDLFQCCFGWLEFEADLDVEPCPFCGSDVSHHHDDMHEASWCQCSNPECGYISGIKPTEAEAVAAHNCMARAVKVKESKKKATPCVNSQI